MADKQDLTDASDLMLEEDDDSQQDLYLTFSVGNEDYGIDIAYTDEIIGIQKITAVPNLKSYIKGIINLRGQIVPVIDIRSRFGLTEAEYDEKTCIIVVFINNDSIGLIVDEVADVMKIQDEQIAPPPQTNKGTKSKYIRGIGKIEKNVVIILDIHKLLYDGKIAREENEE